MWMNIYAGTKVKKRTISGTETRTMSKTATEMVILYSARRHSNNNNES